MKSLPVVALVAALATTSAAPAEPLPSWNDGAAKRAIVGFVESTTTPTSRNFVPPARRIAVFDNDGTLWGEQPYYYQLAFALDRVRALAPAHPEWRTDQPFKAALEGDLKPLFAGGDAALLELVMASHAGTTTEEFDATVRQWLATARHPRTGRPHTGMVYQPMLEVLRYLRANGYKTYIVSGGGVEFVRAFAEEVYGVPPEQVVGSRIRTRYEVRAGVPTLVRLPEVNFVDDKAGKPVGIHQHIGRRPIAAFGNSDGDFEMLEWVTAGRGPRLGLLVHHDDAAREFAYDRKSAIGRLDRGLDEAPKRGWVTASMKDDWRTVFPSCGQVTNGDPLCPRKNPRSAR
jgi:phosphoserine phosphatase